jgi:hypothetical protein
MRMSVRSVRFVSTYEVPMVIQRGIRQVTTSFSLRKRLAEVNQELWLVLSLFVVAALLNWLMDSGRMILGLCTLPTIFSAYVYGRRHAVLTASGSIVLVIILAIAHGERFLSAIPTARFDRLADVAVWAGLLLVTAYCHGHLVRT